MPRWLIIVIVAIAVVIMCIRLACQCMQGKAKEMVEGIEANMDEAREIGKNGTMAACIKATVAGVEQCGSDAMGAMKCGMQAMPFITACLEAAPFDQALCDSLPEVNQRDQQPLMTWGEEQCAAHGVAGHPLCPQVVSGGVAMRCRRGETAQQ